MTRPQTKAIAIQMISGAWSGSYWDVGDFHDAPYHVEDGGKRDAEEQQQEGVVQHPLHEGYGSAVVCGAALPGRLIRIRHCSLSFVSPDLAELRPAVVDS
jgi:hypothetical protein